LVIALFALITWITIAVFFLIPKALSRKEHIVLFFCISLLVISAYTIIDLNLKLVQQSNKAEMFFALLMHRNIIISFCLLIFVNSFMSLHNKLSKFFSAAVILLVLYLVELLTVWTGVKVYLGWNNYLTIITLVTGMAISALLTKWIRKLS
jgi:hypothetical protein